MRTLLLTGAAALSLAAIPFTAIAQQASTTTEAVVSGPYVLTTEQQVTYDTWPPDRQTVYTTWVPVSQEYYWTLTPAQADAYWLLTDEQRNKIYVMTPAQRTIAWQSIERQLAGAQTANEANAAVPPVTETTVATRLTADGQEQAVVTTSTSNAVPPPAQALNKSYPLCSKTVQDSCQNRGEGGAPGKSNAIGYWPGKPASETDTGG
jgi:hypothetical protein